MKIRVLDSWPILEWIGGREPATGFVRSILAETESENARLFMSAINVGEVYYFLRKHHDKNLAESWRDLSATLPMKIEVPTLNDIWAAAVIKGSYAIAYADAFAVALAQKHDCPLVSGDPELRSIAALEIEWVGRVKQ